jgi:hypothetical protein
MTANSLFSSSNKNAGYFKVLSYKVFAKALPLILKLIYFLCETLSINLAFTLAFTENPYSCSLPMLFRLEDYSGDWGELIFSSWEIIVFFYFSTLLSIVLISSENDSPI